MPTEMLVAPSDCTATPRKVSIWEGSLFMFMTISLVIVCEYQPTCCLKVALMDEVTEVPHHVLTIVQYSAASDTEFH